MFVDISHITTSIRINHYVTNVTKVKYITVFPNVQTCENQSALN